MVDFFSAMSKLRSSIWLALGSGLLPRFRSAFLTSKLSSWLGRKSSSASIPSKLSAPEVQP